MTDNTHSSLIIIGGGPAGLTAALYAQQQGLDYLLIEKDDFPKDKVCGDSIPVLSFRILDELNIPYKDSAEFHSISAFEFLFTSQFESSRLYFELPHRLKHFSCKRLAFDNLLFESIKDKRRFINSTVVELGQDQSSLCLLFNNGTRKTLTYDNLIIATGSGRNLLDMKTDMANDNMAVASRAYVSVEHAGTVNLVEFSRDLSPGYFWAFPVAHNMLNTGIYIHQKQKIPELYDKHRQKIFEHFKTDRCLEFRRWPLRIHPPVDSPRPENIRLIGDANHCVDPLLGHGIDVAMLAARDEILCLGKSGKFSDVSKVNQLILKRGEISLSYTNILREEYATSKQMKLFEKFIDQSSEFYTSMNAYLEESRKTYLPI